MRSPIGTLIIISPGFPKDVDDTTCLPAQQLFVKTLNRIWPELKVIVVALQYPRHAKQYIWHGNEIIPFNGLSYGKILRPVLWWRVSRRLEKVHNKKDTGVLSFWYTDTALVGKRFARKHGLRHYCWILGQDARKQNPYARWLNVDGMEIIALSDFLANEFLRNHGERPSFIIPNGIDPAAFEPYGATERSIDLLGVGSLIPLKQYEVFIDVVADLKQNQPHIRAVLCGAGPEEGRLREKIRTLDLEQNILLAGEVPHKEALSMMQKSRILLHPSSYEGYSSACVEALYAGCHVISFTRPEERDIDHWHVVVTQEEMTTKAAEILDGSDFSSVLVHSMEESARKIIELF